MTTKGAYPFTIKEAQYRNYTLAALWFARRDAMHAAESMKGVDPVAEGWYMDDVGTLATEIGKRLAAMSDDVLLADYRAIKAKRARFDIAHSIATTPEFMALQAEVMKRRLPA